MCSMFAVAMGAEATGTLMKGIAENQQGEATKRADNLSADSAERSAASAVEAGKIKELQVVMRGSSVVQAQRVIQSGSGADINIGAPKATQDATAAVSELDRQTVERNAALEAYGLRGRARAFRQHGEDAAAAGKNAMIGTFLGGIASIGTKVGGFAAGMAGSGGSGDTSYGGGSEPDEAD